MTSRRACKRVLNLRMTKEGSSGKVATAANRTREIRLSGMRGGLDGNVGHGETRNPPHGNRKGASWTPSPKAARTVILLDKPQVRFCEGH